MKKILSLLLAMLMLLSFAACSPSPSDVDDTTSPTTSYEASEEPSEETSEEPAPEPANLHIAAMKGPTAIGLLQLMEKSDSDATFDSYEFTLAGAPDAVTGNIINGNIDIACIPTNLAATLFNKTGGNLQIIANVTLGTLYVLTTRGDINSVADLEGKTIWSSGMGATPQYALEYVLKQNGVTADVQYTTENSEIAAHFQTGDADIAVLPQPFVASVLMQNKNVKVALDLTEEWTAINPESGLVMTAVIAQKELIENNPEALSRFLELYSESVEFVDENLDATAKLAVMREIIANENIAKAAIPECHIVFITGDEMKTLTAGFLEVLYEANPQSVGAALPGDEIYYIAD